ncbi:beta-ketoacyl synthase [Bacterioplanes sanyensis]|uniref:Beta-ketoacyl synthase n=1 Tax=Bacterioplanes sanyensis TaxID=1249553 RepID=A0A222FKG9_9GAMM|nr:beta-ketoacyl synthase [Bacterioplanes sanyensis]ASP39508.1 beta-ketoacyl synthase [Bacterioplanes sanyensis]
MRKLAVITGFGGINAAGRSSGHHAFRRIIEGALNTQQRSAMLASLAQISGKPCTTEQHIDALLQGSLIRGWDNVPFDSQAVPVHVPFKDADGHDCLRIEHKRLAVQSGGQLPHGFDPAAQYPSRHHPRGLQMAVYGASDALSCLGMDWQRIRQHLQPDQIGVYAGSAMGQLDAQGHGGMLQSALKGKRTSSKQCALGLSEMPADFINAYVLGSVGATGSMVGACATFLYNLKTAADDIQSGRRRLVIVGNSEAPLVPEIIEGYNAMTALATEQNLRALDGVQDSAAADLRRASRPFGHNCGFTLGESAQFFVLTDDQLALELGLTIHAAVGDVFVHADGYKKSISGPGVGNYITMGKAMAEAQRWCGEQALRQGSFVQAHGSSTPHNRTTESHIYAELAQAFAIQDWSITAAKAYVGHSIGAASADQLLFTLGAWHDGWLPGITTTERVADDVDQRGLNFLLQHQQFDASCMPLAFINAKGFGGNNASAFMVSPTQTRQWLQEKYGSQAWHDYLTRNDSIRAQAADNDQRASQHGIQVRYQFGEQVLQPEQLDISPERIVVPGWQHSIPL